ncbi:hypothetical protein D3C79_605540 [compost metagenome]
MKQALEQLGVSQPRQFTSRRNRRCQRKRDASVTVGECGDGIDITERKDWITPLKKLLDYVIGGAFETVALRGVW